MKGMGLRTSDEYLERLREMRPNVYIGGERVRRDDKRLLPCLRVICKTFEEAQKPKYEGLMTTPSHLSEEKINRFTHVCQTPEDLLKKQQMIRTYCRMTGGCIQRCMGCDAINALSVVTYELDEAFGTDYHARFLEYLREFQQEDMVAAAAQTDVKGNRVLRPHQQADPDLYVRVVERRSDGIVVRGAKNSITIAAYADELIVLPTRAMTERDADWAVSFAVPADAEGVHLVTRATAPRQRKVLKAPYTEYGIGDSFVVFDDVFVPWDRVFMCGEWQLAGRLATLFALFHRHSYTACKPALTDVFLGAAVLVSEYSGILGREHVRRKLVDLACVAELVYAAGIASAVFSKRATSGTCIPNVIYTNVGRRHVGLNIYHEYDILADLAGGLPATLPFEDDFFNEETKGFLEKYIKRAADIPSENVHRCFRLLSDILCSAHSGVMQLVGVHGGGSPIMEEIAVYQNYDFEDKKKVAEYLAGIRGDLPDFEVG